MVRIPMATSMKKVENPVTQILLSLSPSRAGRTSRRVFSFVKKWASSTTKVMADPTAVANPAPYAPISQTNTKK